MSENHSSRVTVLMAVYNGMPYLRHAIESIQNQTLQNFKAIVFNDGSTDGTTAYLDKLNDPRFRIIHQENVGLAVTLNRMIELADTEFVARMDADDICMPTRFERQLEFLDQHSDVTVLGTRAGYVMGERSVASFGIACKKITLSYAPPLSNPPYWDPVSDREILSHSSVMMRTKQLKDVGGYPNMVPGQDLALWHRFSQHGFKLANLDQMLMLIRITKSGISGGNLAKQYHAWCYTDYISRNIENAEQSISLEEYKKMNPLSRQQVAALESRAMMRNALADILACHYMAGICSLVIIFMKNPSMIIKKIVNRI